MTHCAGLAATAFPSGGTCRYVANGGSDGPHDCNGQFSGYNSLRVVRGGLWIYKNYDGHPEQPDNDRCSGETVETPISADPKKCVDYDNGEGPWKGFWMDNASPPSVRAVTFEG